MIVRMYNPYWDTTIEVKESPEFFDKAKDEVDLGNMAAIRLTGETGETYYVNPENLALIVLRHDKSTENLE